MLNKDVEAFRCISYFIALALYQYLQFKNFKEFGYLPKREYFKQIHSFFNVFLEKMSFNITPAYSIYLRYYQIKTR